MNIRRAVVAALVLSATLTGMPPERARAVGSVSRVVPGTRIIEVNGQPFVGKGYMYWPMGIGTTLVAGTWADPVQCENDARLLAGAGVNLLRVYYEELAPALVDNYRRCMDSFWARGIGLLWLIQPPSINQKPTSLGTDPDAWVEHYKPWIKTAIDQLGSHPASYMWTIDNEADGSVDGTCDTLRVFLGNKSNGTVGIADRLFVYAKSLDPTRIVGTTVGGCADRVLNTVNVPNLDFWGVNSYSPTRFPGSYFTDMNNPAHPSYDPRPRIITEFGEDRYRCVGGLVHGITCATPASGEDQAMQQTWNVASWRNIAANLATPANPNGPVSGGTVFMWSDLWWYTFPFVPASQNEHDTVGSTPWGNTDGIQNFEWWGVNHAVAQGSSARRVTSLAHDGLAAEWRPGVPQPTISGFTVSFSKDPATGGATCVADVSYTTAVAADTEVQVATDGETFNAGGDMVMDNTIFGPAAFNGAAATSHSIRLQWAFVPGPSYKIVARSTVPATGMSATMQPFKIRPAC